MEKVTGVSYYNSIGSSSVANGGVASQGPLERSPMIRGHHSSINKAVEAHRQMVDQRQSRQSERREMALLAQQQKNNPDTSWISQASEDAVSADTGTDYQMYENTLIESPSTQAKMASIQSFQTTEPDRPLMGEPVPKGSYLDVEI